MDRLTLFASGDGGYHTYRIPALAVTGNGTILAFAEARRDNGKDAGDIDIVLKRSLDHGKTWSDMQVIADVGEHTIGNPCPVVDRNTGTVWLLLCRNLSDGDERKIMRGEAPRDVLVMSSADDGETWSELRDITLDVKRPEWTWYATGPGHGIQLQNGRLLIPCNHAVLDLAGERDPHQPHWTESFSEKFQENRGGSGPYTAHTIYSDDGGQTWRIGGAAGPLTNECMLAEMADGAVYLNMRSYHQQSRRAFAWSRDSGLSWSDTRLDSGLPEPTCQASVLTLTAAAEQPERLLFLNPNDPAERINLTLKCSADRCESWKEIAVLHAGPSAYSDMCLTGVGQVGCLYECGDNGPYERIDYASLMV